MLTPGQSIQLALLLSGCAVGFFLVIRSLIRKRKTVPYFTLAEAQKEIEKKTLPTKFAAGAVIVGMGYWIQDVVSHHSDWFRATVLFSVIFLYTSLWFCHEYQSLYLARKRVKELTSQSQGGPIYP